MDLEGQKAGTEMNKLLPNGGNIIELSGTTGSGAAVGRSAGERKTLNKNITILDSQTGNFTTRRSQTRDGSLLEEICWQNQWRIFSQNDDMTKGAVQAMTEAGIKPGDIPIVSFDGTRGGFQMMIDGWVKADVECNPLLGPQVFDMALKLMNGQAISPRSSHQ